MRLRPALALLIRQQVARINVCEFCIDISRYVALQRAISEAKLDALDEHRTSHRLAEPFSDREMCAITWLVASEHVYNLTNIGLNIHSDLLCDLSPRKLSSGWSIVGASSGAHPSRPLASS